MGDSNYSKTNKTNDRAIQRASEPTQRKINDAICKKDAKGNYGPVCSAVHCGWHGAMVAKDNVVNLGKHFKHSIKLLCGNLNLLIINRIIKIKKIKILNFVISFIYL
jgi:hypothetical protein